MDEARSPSSAIDPTVVLALRGAREQRPRIDPLLAGGLRAWLEDELTALAEALDPEAPLLLTPRSIVGEPVTALAPLRALARGALVSNLVAQRISVGEVRHPMDDALSALEADPGRRELVEAIHALDQDSFAQLSAELAAHDEVLSQQLSGIPSSWLPASNVSMSVSLAGGRLLLHAMVNVVLGAPALDLASRCLLDVTTASLDDRVQRRLAALGLIETLRSGAAPFRVASLSTATGEVAILEVSDEVLAGAVRDVAEAARRRGATR
jgi:hypothetical protein